MIIFHSLGQTPSVFHTGILSQAEYSYLRNTEHFKRKNELPHLCKVNTFGYKEDIRPELRTILLNAFISYNFVFD